MSFILKISCLKPGQVNISDLIGRLDEGVL